MRELSFVKRIKFKFSGSITKRALVIGDADNDGHNELVCANLQGELAIFKDHNSHKIAYADGLGMITACAVGDLINIKRNLVVVINMEGWLFVFDVGQAIQDQPERIVKDSQCDQNDETNHIMTGKANDEPDQREDGTKLNVFYEQRMPANCKEILLADLDGDGQNELIIGLTDRVLRTYKWINLGDGRGKFVGLYKWEFADQIGSVSLNPSRRKNCTDIIVAQPGGTYARLECFDKKPNLVATPSTSSDSGGSDDKNKKFFPALSEQPQDDQQVENETFDGGDNVKTEYINKLTPEYHQLIIAHMRNHHISTEVLGGIRDSKGSKSLSSLVLATLDGKLMLVNKDEILWSLQVDQQLFALAVIERTKDNDQKSTSLPQSESTCTIVAASEGGDQARSSNAPGNCYNQISYQYFVVCAWNGKTYIIDEERNYLQFKFDEAVSAFTAGNYFLNGEHRPALVYATFNNNIVLYYDVVSDDIRPKYLLEELMNNPNYADLKAKLKLIQARLNDDISTDDEDSMQEKFYNLVHDILYKINDDDLGI